MKINTIENLKRDNGYIEFEGKEFILTQSTYLDYDYITGSCYYHAMAICPEDQPDSDGWQPAYSVQFELLDTYNPDTMEEEYACDWNEPERVSRRGEYTLMGGRYC